MTAPAQPNRGSQQPQEQRSAPDANTFAAAVANGIDNKFIEWADKYGNWIAHPDRDERDDNDKVSTSQIRNVFGTIKKLEMESTLNMQRILLLKPRIAYAAEKGSSKKNHVTYKNFRDVIIKAIDAVNDGINEEEKKIRFDRFSKGFEAILAYHRAAGGK